MGIILSMNLLQIFTIGIFNLTIGGKSYLVAVWTFTKDLKGGLILLIFVRIDGNVKHVR